MMGFGKMSPDLKKAMMRLEKDRQELINSPVANVSAAPLDSDMLEWHCNIKHGDAVYHVILFFPKEYPCVSPSAEFVPHGFEYQGGAAMGGKKGTKICLSIFSDFAKYHTEWANETQTGWSPGYTVQTVLLNLVSFLSDMDPEIGRRRRSSQNSYLQMCKKFVCSDCGHSWEKPYPPLSSSSLPSTSLDDGGKMVKHESKTSQCSDDPNTASNNCTNYAVADAACANDSADRCDSDPQTIGAGAMEDPRIALTSNIIDYVSKERFSLERPISRDQLFGYGLIVTPGNNPHQKFLTSPCELLTGSSFNQMVASLGEAKSVNREPLHYFLPLYITSNHGSMIRLQFEETMKALGSILFPDMTNPSLVDIILKVIPNLMCSTVVQFSKGTVHTSDNSLEGYFALHRLFIWAIEIYPELVPEVRRRLETFVKNPKERNKKMCPDIGQWLMLLSVSSMSWNDVAQAYLSESFNRNVMWYVRTDPSLAKLNTPMDHRLSRTFELTSVSRNLLAFQVTFLRIAKPPGMSKADVLKRYEDNLGFPTSDMVQQLKGAFIRINNDVTRFDHWYKVIGVAVPTQAQLYDQLKASVKKHNEGNYYRNNGHNGHGRYNQNNNRAQ